MSEEFLTGLLPVLGRPVAPGFNVFDVMHHGLHERQLSNVFAWLLDEDGTHGFGRTFIDLLLTELNRRSPADAQLPLTRYAVLQERNTGSADEGRDIADIVLESDEARVVIENYFISDGHGHSYDGYLRYSQEGGRIGRVMLLCRDEDAVRQTGGWENAAALTYGALVKDLLQTLERDRSYKTKNPDAYSFIQQMHAKFVEGKNRMADKDVLDFVVAMCSSGQAQRYQVTPHAVGAEEFANSIALQAKERFGEGRVLLQEVKDRLKSYSQKVVVPQLNASQGEGFAHGVSTGFQGIYQWTINFAIAQEGGKIGEHAVALKFGPSAWRANEFDADWKNTVPADEADYSYIFVTRAQTLTVVQSSVSIQEVLDGLEPTDTRLHDQIVALLQEPLPATQE